MKKTAVTRGLLICTILLSLVVPVSAWSNRGEGEDRDYGTHAWIADHSLHAVLSFVEGTDNETRFDWLVENHEAYLLGTVAPDFPFKTVKGANFLDYFDVLNHHNYYNDSVDDLIRDRASKRAQQEFEKAVEALHNEEWELAAFCTGAMTHYLADLSNFHHVMGNASPLGSESREEHRTQERAIRKHTSDLESTYFTIIYEDLELLNFTHAAYEAGRWIGWFSHEQAEWMNANFQEDFEGEQATTEFELRTEAALSYGINHIANLVYTLGFYEASPYTEVSTPFNWLSTWVFIFGGLLGLLILGTLLILVIRKVKNR